LEKKRKNIPRFSILKEKSFEVGAQDNAVQS